MPLGLGSFTRAVCNRARRGLYAGRRVLSGNQISEDGGNKSRRTWKPNSHNKRLYSHILARMVPLRVTAAALRTIDKVGGLDAYILNTPDKKLQSDVAIELRTKMLERLVQQQQAALASQAQQQQYLPPAAAAVAAAAAQEAPV
ncbi:54S ribosomal protein L24 [Chlorella vulgaris]